MEKPHKKLDAWKLAMELVIKTYRFTETFPAKETYGLTDQIRRAAVSVPSNIAEGAARQLEIAKQLGYLGEKDWGILDAEAERIDKMISGLIRQQKFANVSRLTPDP